MVVVRGGISFIIPPEKRAEWEEKGFIEEIKPLPQPKPAQTKAQPKKKAAK